MSYSCACATDAFNSGSPSNQKAVDQSVKWFRMHLNDSSGTPNKITKAEINSVLTPAFLTGKLENTNAMDRWYIYGKYTAPTDIREEPNFQEFEDSSRSTVLQGRRTVTGNLVSYAALYQERIEYWKCHDHGIIGIDSCGNWVAKRIDNSGDLYPIEVNKTSLFGKVVKGSNGEIAHIMEQFDYDMLEKDSDLRVLEKGKEVTANALTSVGLIDLKATNIVDPTTLAWTVALTVNYGEEWNPDKAGGFVLADFNLFNETTNLAVVLSSVTEAPEAQYLLAYPAQGTGNVLRLTLISGGKILEPFTGNIP